MSYFVMDLVFRSGISEKSLLMKSRRNMDSFCVTIESTPQNGQVHKTNP